MGRTGTRLPSFCLNRVATRVRVRSPSIESKPLSPSTRKFSAPLGYADEKLRGNGGKPEMEQGRRIMIVVDSSPEAKAALLWGLSHSVQSNDTVVLVQVELCSVEGKERGPTIVEEAGKQGASLLVMGQRKRSTTWRLIMMWAGNKVGGGTVDYCVQNATCMALAVRRKCRRGGGYLITTKRHKDFWLLA
ncbi:hypothetical protein GW17_00056914 [Ensete ventricosum]|nr:hypothetical protein GW17_00056914 [Ensete ventricosum]